MVSASEASAGAAAAVTSGSHGQTTASRTFGSEPMRAGLLGAMHPPARLRECETSREPAQNLGGSFDNDADNNIFKATFGSSFASLSFGNVAQPPRSANIARVIALKAGLRTDLIAHTYRLSVINDNEDLVVGFVGDGSEGREAQLEPGASASVTFGPRIGLA